MDHLIPNISLFPRQDIMLLPSLEPLGRSTIRRSNGAEANLFTGGGEGVGGRRGGRGKMGLEREGKGREMRVRRWLGGSGR